jgi:prepilin-type N-terminal cleavage/methylation domain-containing protein
MRRRTFNNTGFTLVELSIVLVIIGLIIGGVLLGKSLKDKSALRAIITEINRYHTAYLLFKEQYEAAPGDISNATTFWAAATNGNGNGIVSGAEAYHAWNHLGIGRSEIISEYYTGTTSYYGVSNPKSKGIQGGYHLGAPGLSIYSLGNSANRPALQLMGGNASAAGSLWGGLTPLQAYEVDKKMDDGQPDKGKLFTVKLPADSADATKCTVNSFAAATAGGLVLTDTTPSCRLFYWVD